MNDFIDEVLTIALIDWKKKDKFWKFLLFASLIGFLIFALGFGFDRIISKSFYAGNYSSFFSFGILVYFIFLGGLMNGGNIVIDKTNFIRLLLVAPISKYSILFGKTLSVLTGSLRLLLLLGAFFLFLNKEFSFIKILLIIIYCIILVTISVATGIFLSTLTTDKKSSEYIVNGFNFVFLFSSGILFPITYLPKGIQFIFRINPLVYVVDLFRFLMMGISEFSLLIDLSVLIIFGFLIVFLGVYQFDRNLRT